MALVSPGVEVSIIDESNYNSARSGTVPLILIATAQNKVNPAGTGVASGTLASNANSVYLISSQRELVNTFGNPFFYNTTNGTPINGYELNEYGLMTAYSVLGVSNRAYVLRADVDLAELAASVTRPTANPADGTLWFDLNDTAWGLFEWNASTRSFVKQTLIEIDEIANLDSGIPKQSIGSVGSYAVVTTNSNNPIYYKNSNNEWVLIGSDSWKQSWPTVTGSKASPVLTVGQTITINGVNVSTTGTTISSLANEINSAGISGVTAGVVSNKLEIYVETSAADDLSSEDVSVTIANSSGTILTDVGIAAGTYYAPILQHSSHAVLPRWRNTDTTPRPSGSIWIKTTSVNDGVNLSVKEFDSIIGSFVSKTCPVYANDETANYAYNPSSAGAGIAQGTLYAQYDINQNNTGTLKIFTRAASGNTVVVGALTNPSFDDGDQFIISASSQGGTSMSTPVTATIDTLANGTGAAAFVAAFLAANVPYTSARVLSTGAVEISHTAGGVIILNDAPGVGNTALADAGITNSISNVRNNIEDGAVNGLILSNWVPAEYSASTTRPGEDPLDGTLWYYSTVDEVDILIKDNNGWKGYQNVSNDARGFDLTATDPNGPIVSASAPTEQSTEDPLVYGDLWIDTSDLENYPLINRWESVDGVDQWVRIDNTDQTSQNGVIYADARWAPNGTTDIITDDIPLITDLLTSNYVDLDCPEESLYPDGMLLFNTRRSGYNVKQFAVNYFNGNDFSGSLPTQKNSWVTASGNKNDGSPYMGRQSQRIMVIRALQAAIDSNTEIREEQRQFNLIAAPNYPELMDNMIALNNDRNNTAFIVGDTPLRLTDAGNELITWATNNQGEGTSTGDGLAVNDSYLGVFYPAGQTNDLSGNSIVVPASHMILRTIIRNDEIGYPWFAPAGTRRGNVDNASALGYVNGQTGSFVQIANRIGVRDTLYENNVNPITFIPGTGIVNYGNKTTKAGSALDRINVARLVAFIRGQLESIAKGFLFEPNDKLTRDEIKNQVEGLMNDLVAKRGIYDYLVVCDESNNTPARIDRNELYVDIAIEPVKAVEFIYVPVRIKNTGDISAGL